MRAKIQWLVRCIIPAISLRENHEKISQGGAKKVIIWPPCILFWNMQDGGMVQGNHKYLVSRMKNSPRAELWAHLRWSEARSVIWGHPIFTIFWWTWSFLTKFRLTWLQVGKKIRKEHFLQFGQSTPSVILANWGRSGKIWGESGPFWVKNRHSQNCLKVWS